MSAEERHDYFKERLYGFDIDPFALEVARLCLLLSDFPSRNGWRLAREDVFNSTKFTNVLKRARVVLCNPPFKDFGMDDPLRSETLSPRKPARLLQHVLSNIPSDGLIGFVLPRVFLDGESYSSIRRQLAERYEQIETVALPDKVFTSGVETALLLCKQPSHTHGRTLVAFTRIPDSWRERFLLDYSSPGTAREQKTPQEAAKNLKVLSLREVWTHLQSCDKLRDISNFHRGIEWQPPFDPEKYISPVDKPGFKPGVQSARSLKCFIAPPIVYLDTRQQSRKGDAFSLSWQKPKVIMNASRVSRGPWCIAAFPDDKGLIAYQDFIAIWPYPGWTIECLAAVLNGPVASAFVAVREDKLHIRLRQTLKYVPVPQLKSEQALGIAKRVKAFIRLSQDPSASAELLQILLQIDATILQAYNLPPPIERQLLEVFRCEERAVPDFLKDKMANYVDDLIRVRLADQLKVLDEDEQEQQETWKHLQKSLAERRLSFKKVSV
jgi:hypothetical protein